ncbi:MAG: Glyceraldehyde-3-phosphate dehydrogenase [Syntrophorhabdus sp. PtaU1.Bin002]|nr:MAG: Glyceraldehyde-3-phosphate dehydrogenase [Syntrophorhabdus sp. PtaB.Bin006]OPY61897.1 MAG: Glyceraldehyde-3-phosphate dehydrogenase [Syntrophorhabdus sp. PtaU1.Bin002]
MPVRVAINGFGRIGRSVFRIGRVRPELDFVAINDLGEPRFLAHLLKHDSLQGAIAARVEATKNSIIVDGKKVLVFAVNNPRKLPWKDLGVDVVLESTGRFTHRDAAYRHIEAGAQKVVVSAPGNGLDVTVVLGINNEVYDREHHQVVSMASCTANCLAPITKILHDEFGILYGHMTTVHGYTNNQVLLDSPHKDLRRARSAALSIIPTTTTAMDAMSRVIPDLAGRLEGISVRVPTPKVALVDFVVTLRKEAGREELNDMLKSYAEGPMKGILYCSDEPLVSTDLKGNPYSSIVDLACTQVLGGRLVKIISWYDNESGFSHRLCDLFPFLMGR